MDTIIIYKTGLILPLLLLAPGQLSFAGGVSSADGWSVIVITSHPLPLLDTDAGVGTYCHIGPAIVLVSVFVLSIVVACILAFLCKVEGDASGADGWCPLSTIPRVIPVLVTPVPSETAPGAIGSTTAPLAVLLPKCVAATCAILFCPQIT